MFTSQSDTQEALVIIIQAAQQILAIIVMQNLMSVGVFSKKLFFSTPGNSNYTEY